MEKRSASGIIFIVDISGFAKFVRNVPIKEGAAIMPLLFKSIVRADELSLRVAEIEGDAILFYRMGETMPLSSILEQFNRMFNSFHTEIQTLKNTHPGITDLTIKAVVHYGQLCGYEIGGYRKLYGKVLVEAHRLLKNHINSHSYVLITKSYSGEEQQPMRNGGIEMCEQYDIGNVCYTYFSYPTIAKGCKIWLG